MNGIQGIKTDDNYWEVRNGAGGLDGRLVVESTCLDGSRFREYVRQQPGAQYGTPM